MTRATIARAVLVVAALASVATSKKREHAKAVIPEGAPTTSPAGGTKGVLYTVETEFRRFDVDAQCALPDPFQLRPLDDKNEKRREFLCPPGGSMLAPKAVGREEPWIDVVRGELVETWTRSVDITIDVSVVEGTGSAKLRIVPDLHPWRLEARADLAVTDASGHVTADLGVSVYIPHDPPSSTKVRVTGLIWDRCPDNKPCSAPDTVRVERVP